MNEKPENTKTEGASQEAVAEQDMHDFHRAINEQYPDEYVVLVGKDVRLHTKDREEAFLCYEEILETSPGLLPTVIGPWGPEKDYPFSARGRSLAGQYQFSIPCNLTSQEKPETAMSMAEIRNIAGQYPDEYIVLIGKDIRLHTKEYEEAKARYAEIRATSPDLMPMVINPGQMYPFATPLGPVPRDLLADPSDVPCPPLSADYIRNEEWLCAHMTELTQKYPDQWVAVWEERVVAADADLGKVRIFVDATYPDATPTYWLVEGTTRIY